MNYLKIALLLNKVKNWFKENATIEKGKLIVKLYEFGGDKEEASK